MREYTETDRARPTAVQAQHHQSQHHQSQLLHRRRAAGPRPVRPAVVPVAVRPVQPGRPRGGVRVLAGAPGSRLLARPAVAHPAAAGARVRRVLAGVVVVLVVAAVVVGLGLLADAVARSRAEAGPAAHHAATAGSPAPVSSWSGPARP